jgi:enoyl-CoA hydratase/carnithine racemase
MSDSRSSAELHVDGGVATVTLRNPGRANALSNQTFRHELPRLWEDIAGRDDLRVVVLTGADRAFSAGSELDADGFGDSTPESTRELLEDSHRNVTLIRGLPIPSIAAIDGVAIGAGLGLAAACDIRIATPRSRMSAPYVRMGLTPDMGLSHLLPELVGVGPALELALTGRMIDAPTALSLGLVDRVSDDALGEADALARTIAANPAGAVRATRALVRAFDPAGLRETLFRSEPAAFADALHSDEFVAAFAAYQAAIARPKGV